MNSESNRRPGPFQEVHKPGPKTANMGGRPYTQDNMEMAHLSDEEQAIIREENALKQKRDDLRRKQEQADQDAKNRLLEDREKALSAAANFRKDARTADEADKKRLYEWAAEADAEVRRIEKALGMALQEDAPADAPTDTPPRRRLLTILQAVGVLSAILYFYLQFEGFGDSIREANHGVAPENQLRPYDITSIQKLFFEKLVVFVDLPLALLLLVAVVPFVGFYVLPFVKAKKDFYTEFFDELTPWQRALISTAFCLGALLFLALSHNVKP